MKPYTEKLQASVDAAAERAKASGSTLFRQGYQLVASEPYLSFEGCEFDKPIKVGGYIFMCRTYEYVYHYGKVELLGRTLTAKGQSVSSVYLCAGEEHCLAGDLYTR